MAIAGMLSSGADRPDRQSESEKSIAISRIARGAPCMAVSLRQELSNFVARHFRVHLLAELSKSDELLANLTWEGIRFDELTKRMLTELDEEFPAARDQPPENVFATWWSSMRIQPGYQESTFKAYNQSTFERIRDLRDGTDESRQKLDSRIYETLRLARFHGRVLTFEVFYTGEGRLYEILREAMEASGLPRAARRLWTRQHEAINRSTYRFFDEALKESLARSEKLLRTILPERVVEELQSRGVVKPALVPNASVLFTDIVGFTQLAQVLSPEELLDELDRCFSHFDLIVRQHRLEKIKTIGDAYMCAGGVLQRSPQHPLDIGLCALRILEFMRKYRKSREREGKPVWDLRIGIHLGPVISGVIGTERFNFDVWGDTVNIASRMEDCGQAQRVNVSQEFMLRTEEFFRFTYRGKILVKGKGELDMYFLDGLRPELTVRGRGKVPSSKFRRAYANFEAAEPSG